MTQEIPLHVFQGDCEAVSCILGVMNDDLHNCTRGVSELGKAMVLDLRITSPQRNFVREAGGCAAESCPTGVFVADTS